MSDAAPEVTGLCDRVGPYFDGELTPAEEQRFARHLETCARCQGELEDLMGLEAALVGRRGKLQPAPVRRGRPRWIAPVVGAVVLAAAAAAVLVIVGPGRSRTTMGSRPEVALAAKRGVEVRFSSPAFDRHRPYEVVRGSAPRESIAMNTLAALERARDQAGLLAAHALAGELQRAALAAENLAPSPEAEADLAALALLADRPEEALAASERALQVAPAHTAARWNRALALRDLELALASAAAFDEVAAAGEPGWAEEAAVRAAAYRKVITDRDAAFAAMRARAPAVTADDVRDFPGYARLYFHDAARLADGAAAVEALTPVAAALDAQAGDQRAAGTLQAVLARDAAVRRRFHARYRALVARTLPPADVDRLLAELAAAGRDVDDLYAGAIVASGRTGAMPQQLARALGPDPSPWFTLMIERERLVVRRTAGGEVEGELTAAAAACDAVRWGYRCARFDVDLAALLSERGRLTEAFALNDRARARFAAAGAVDQEDGALVFAGELARHAGRDALAVAIFDEIAARTTGTACELARYARVGAAVVSLARGDLPGARAHLPAPDLCGGAAADGQGIMVAVDLARAGDAADVTRAEAWLATAFGDAQLVHLAAIGNARLAIARDPSGGRTAMRAALAGLAGSADPRADGLRAWGNAALISDGGVRGDWAAVFADAAAGAGLTLPARCVVVAGTDDARVVVAVRDATGALHGESRDLPIAEQATAPLVSPAILRHVAGCDQIAVLAGAPLHGRATLLPPELPWFFLADAAPLAPPAAPPQIPVLVVSDPATTSAPRLTPQQVSGATALTGAGATPSAVRDALRVAGYAELHVHGVADLETSDGSYLLLAPDADGHDQLTARDVSALRLTGAPVVVLAACRAADVASHLRSRWSLPDAFITAGARAVIAADTDLPDQEAAALFAELRTRVLAGAAPAAALAELRARPAWTTWASHLMLFQRPN